MSHALMLKLSLWRACNNQLSIRYCVFVLFCLSRAKDDLCEKRDVSRLPFWLLAMHLLWKCYKVQTFLFIRAHSVF